MLTLTVNGRKMELDESISGRELLSRLDQNGATLVIERNGQILPLVEFLDSQLGDGDVLELVTLVGGG